MNERDEVLSIARSFLRSEALFLGVQLGIFEVLEKAPATPPELAAIVNVDTRPLESLLSALQELGLMRRGTDGKLANTGLTSRYLVSSGPDPLTAYILWKQRSLSLWDRAGSVFRRELPTIYGNSLYSFLGEHLDDYRLFQDALSDLGRPLFAKLPVVISALVPQSSEAVFVDVGAGAGDASASVLLACSNIRAELIDISLDKAREALSEKGLASRVQFHELDILTSAIPPGDIYFFGNMLCDWPDAEVLYILSKVRYSLGPTGFLAILDRVPTQAEKSNSFLSLLFSVETLGRFRTYEEWQQLLAHSGLTIQQTYRIDNEFSILLVHRSEK